MTKKNLTVLVTGTDSPGFSSIIRSLKLSKKYNFRIIGTDWNRNLKSLYFADTSYILPDNKTPEFIHELLKVCEKEKVDFVIPIRTDDQLPICNHLKEFDSIGTIPLIITSNPELMSIALNKYKMLEYIKHVASLKTMNYRLVNTKNQLELALKELNYPKNPVTIKPTHTTGSRGFRILDQTINRKKIFFDEKPSSTYITKEELFTILGDDFQDMLVMEYLQEPEFTLDVLCYKGKTFTIIPRKRLKMTSGITVKGIIEKLPKETEQYIKKVIESFGFTYSVGLQIRKSSFDDKTYHLIEINPRLQGTTVFSVVAGINLPEQMISMGLKEFDFTFEPKIKYGLEMERIYLELFYYNNAIIKLEDEVKK